MNTDLADRILSGPEYFRCDRLSCTMAKEVCFARQKLNRRKTESLPWAVNMTIPWECHDCSQGAAIAQELAQAQPGRVAGVSKTIIKEKPMGNQEKECRKCGKTKSLEEFHVNKLCRLGRDSQCKECKREQQKQQRAAARLERQHDSRVPYVPEDEKVIQPSKPLKVVSMPSTSITLNFEGYENVLEWLSRTAADNFRNPDQQALYVLHQVAAAKNKS